MAAATASGSTAPAITSPLLAWPARPSARSSPLSTPSSGSFDDLPPASSLPTSKAGSTSSLAASSSAKGKEKEHPLPPTVRISPHHDDDADDDYRPPRRYGPPNRPLSPNQLGRIAQSFGIVIPSLPQPPPIPAQAASSSSPISSRSLPSLSPASHRRPRQSSAPRPSPFLLAIIPPLCLLPPSPEEGSEARAKRFRRGRLLALQPTMGSMLLLIAREYGLPSTVGLSLYLCHPSSASSSSTLSDDAGTGPQISPSAWSTLFSTHLHASAAPSRTSTPSQTPLKQSGSLGRDIAFPPSPLSPFYQDNIQPPLHQRQRLLSTNSAEPTPTRSNFSLSSQPKMSSSSSAHNLSSASNLPLTPSSLSFPLSASASASGSNSNPNPIIGTVEFDIDLDQATWFPDWLRSGGASRRSHRRLPSTASTFSAPGGPSSGGIKTLRLPIKVDRGPRFLRELDVNRANALTGGRASFDSFGPKGADEDDDEDDDDRDTESQSHGFGPTPDTTVSHEVEEADLDGLWKTAAGEPALKSARSPEFKGIRSIVQGGGGAVSASDSLDEVRDLDGEGSRYLMAREKEGDDALLRSPIELGFGGEAAVERAMGSLGEEDRLKVRRLVDEKRASGLVMSDELDDLEKIMRQLSPREIRLTSPRALTPRMAAKVASANLTFPPVPHARKSPLATDYPTPSPPAQSAPALAPPLPATSTQGPPPPSSSANQQELSWPAVPFAKMSDSPTSPSLDGYFRPPLKSSVQSAETLKRMQASPPRAGGGEWKPRRPVRPPTPDLEALGAHTRTLSHTLSPELVEQLRSPPREPASPVSPDGGAEKPRLKGRSGSISLKGLRSQMSGKGLNQMFRQSQEPPPALPRDRSTSENTAVHGLFRQPVDPTLTTFASLRSSSDTHQSTPATTVDEFGARAPSSPSGAGTFPREKERHGFRGMFGTMLGRKGSDAAHKSPKEREREGITWGGGRKRHPSHDGPPMSQEISAPIPETLHRVPQNPRPQPPPPHHGQEGDAVEDGLASPRSVRRKPVDYAVGAELVDGGVGGMRASESLGSVRGFSLDEAPRDRKRNNAAGMGIAV